MIYITKNGDRLRGGQGNKYTDHPPCWRDMIYNKIGVMMSSLLQGIMVVGFVK